MQGRIRIYNISYLEWKENSLFQIVDAKKSHLMHYFIFGKQEGITWCEGYIATEGNDVIGSAL